MIRLNLELVEALCGFKKTITTLDQRELLITSLPGQVIKHNDLKFIPDEGMPMYKDPFTKGRLIVQFNVVFPTTIDVSVLPQLEKCLPPRQEMDIPDEVEEVSMMDYDPEYESRHRERHARQAYEEDNDGGSSRVQCATN